MDNTSSMTPYADLELSLHRRGSDAYTVEVRFSMPDSDDFYAARGASNQARFDFDHLRKLALDSTAYGRTC